MELMVIQTQEDSDPEVVGFQDPKNLPSLSSFKPDPVVLNENSNWCFHEYQSTARISVYNADAKINTNGQMIF